MIEVGQVAVRLAKFRSHRGRPTGKLFVFEIKKDV